MKTDNIYLEVAKRLNQPNSQIVLRIVKKLMSPMDAKLLLMLPAEPGTLSRQSGLDENTVKQKLQEFLERGFVFPTSKGLQFARDASQLHDASLSSADRWIDEELLDLWKEFHETEWIPLSAHIPEEIHVQRIRTLPAIKALEKSPDITAADIPPEEDIKELINKSDPIVVVPCSCRKSMRRCRGSVNICLQFNKSAKFHLDRKAGRKITAKEALDIAMHAEEEGLVHTWPVRSSGAFNELCNCCRDCCVIFDVGLRYDNIGKILDKTHFRATVDTAECTGCNDCVDRCFFSAIELFIDPKTKKPKAVIDAEKCFGCGVCVVACPCDAIVIKPV